MAKIESTGNIRGGSRISRWGGRQPPTQALFGENICKNERIWSCWGGGARRKLLYVDPPLNMVQKLWLRNTENFMLFDVYDLDFDPITLVFKLDLNNIVTYLIITRLINQMVQKLWLKNTEKFVI